ncbi:MAG TPA: hypothetical protein VJB63_03665 [Patescibacteria group bacterium]|nr:hypothetical protein [Patescibacteria group bacterium]
MKISLNFGDIFRYKGNDYVFLAASERSKYVAIILDKEFTKQLKIRESKPSKIPLNQQRLFCYIILETPEYDGRACYHGNADSHNDIFDLYIDNLNIELSKKDKEELKKDILIYPINAEIKELVSKIIL